MKIPDGKMIWLKSTNNTLVDLGFKATVPNLARKLNGTFTMADGYVVPENDFNDVVSLLGECGVPHEID